MIDRRTQTADAATGHAVVLRALANHQWRTSAEIIDETELLPLAVRSVLRDLAGRGLVRRSITGGWQITASGAVEAADNVEGRSR